jgi:uncharacterized membrane protein YkoI
MLVGSTRQSLLVTQVVATLLAFAWVGFASNLAMAQSRKTRFSSMIDWNLKAENLKPRSTNPYYLTDKVCCYGAETAFDTSDSQMVASSHLNSDTPEKTDDMYHSAQAKPVAADAAKDMSSDKTKTASITEAKAKEIAAQAVKGKVIDVAIEKKLGANRYVVEVIRESDGAEVDVIIEIETGKVLAIEE